MPNNVTHACKSNMNQLKDKIVAVMQQDSQAHTSLFSLKALLKGLSLVYGAGLALRQSACRNGRLPQYRLPCRVMSIGNLTTGGTGKTPMTIKTAQLLQQMGRQVVVISRGYRGTAEKAGGVVSDGGRLLMGPAEAGDEPVLLAGALPDVPVLVGADRYQVGRQAVRRFSPDVILLDDTFQHRRLYRDLDLVLLDSEKPFGNGCLLPRGLLREPIDALERADAVMLTRRQSHHAAWPDLITGGCERKLSRPLRNHISDIPVFTSRHVPGVCRIIRAGQDTGEPGFQIRKNHQQPQDESAWLSGRRVHAFCGIARNDAFFNTLKTFQVRRLTFQAFQDHHAYTDSDLQRISDRAQANHADLIVTTEKDYVRIADRIAFPADLMVLGVKMELTQGDAVFSDFLRKHLRL